MKWPPLELFWYWCEQKKHYGFSSKNWYLLLASVRAWFSSKISDDYPCTPLTFMWEYSTPPFPGLRITHDAFPVHGAYRTSYWSIFLRCAALFPSCKKVMLENFLRDRHEKINSYSPLQWKTAGIGGFVYPYSTLVHDSRLIQLFFHGQHLSKKLRTICVWKYLKIGNANK